MLYAKWIHKLSYKNINATNALEFQVRFNIKIP